MFCGLGIPRHGEGTAILGLFHALLCSSPQSTSKWKQALSQGRIMESSGGCVKRFTLKFTTTCAYGNSRLLPARFHQKMNHFQFELLVCIHHARSQNLYS